MLFNEDKFVSAGSVLHHASTYARSRVSFHHVSEPFFNSSLYPCPGLFCWNSNATDVIRKDTKGDLENANARSVVVVSCKTYSACGNYDDGRVQDRGMRTPLRFIC
jgi:hypothetical protein